ncbi:MAG: type II toxin-antitoxin system prevent-host-death family antitoxin [Sphaerochaetaceae bacterium]|nr:type II toxin-antitoxin system prevent-host-death family antitoxin [Sphaerochaetaceae bacterium]
MEVSRKTWHLQEAKSRLSVVVDLALSGSLQPITKRGEPVVNVISVEPFRKAISAWKTTLLSRPHKDFTLHISRDSEFPSELDL